MGTEVALITGAADGIGWAMAQTLLGQGTASQLQISTKLRLTTERRSWGETTSRSGAMCRPNPTLSEWFERSSRRSARSTRSSTMRALGTPIFPTLEQTVEKFQQVVDVHLKGTFLASREVARVMLIRGSGSIVNISSIAGLTGLPRRNAYGAAKAGVVALTRAMACRMGLPGTSRQRDSARLRGNGARWQTGRGWPDRLRSYSAPYSDGPPRRAGRHRRSRAFSVLAASPVHHRGGPQRRRGLAGVWRRRGRVCL